MGGAIFKDRCENRTTSINSLADQIMQEHYEAQAAWDVQDFVAEVIDHIEFLQRIWKVSIHRAITGSGDEMEFHTHGQFMLEIIDRAMKPMESAENCIRWATNNHHSIDGASEFSLGFAEIKRIRHRIMSRWPMDRPDRMKEALDDFREGRTRSPREIIDELQNRDS